MSTIQSTSTNSSSLYAQLGQSLVGLSNATQPAVLGEPDDPNSDSGDLFAPMAAAAQTAIQNQLSALADSDAATAATKSAVSLLASQSTALAAQANLQAPSVLGLLESDGS